MSVVWECARVEAAVERARSLVSAHGAASNATAFGVTIESAAESTLTARHVAGDMSGTVVAQHDSFAIKSAVTLKAAGQTDAALQANLTSASAIARSGAQHLDTIAIRTRAISQAGATETFPAAQRIIMTALRSQLAEATDVVDSVRQRGAEHAKHISALQYEPPHSPLRLQPQPPTGPIVWCLRPRGTFGLYRCSVLYPDLRVGTYWSPSDDTGGSQP